MNLTKEQAIDTGNALLRCTKFHDHCLGQEFSLHRMFEMRGMTNAGADTFGYLVEEGYMTQEEVKDHINEVMQLAGDACKTGEYDTEDFDKDELFARNHIQAIKDYWEAKSEASEANCDRAEGLDAQHR